MKHRSTLAELGLRASLALRGWYCRHVAGHRWVIVRNVNFWTYRGCARCGALERGKTAIPRLVLEAPDSARRKRSA